MNKDAASTAVIAMAMTAVLLWVVALPGLAFDQADLERLLVARSFPECDLSRADLSKADLTGAVWIDGRTCGPGSRGGCRLD